MNTAGRACPVMGSWEFASGRKRDSDIATRSYCSGCSRREAPAARGHGGFDGVRLHREASPRKCQEAGRTSRPAKMTQNTEPMQRDEMQ